MAEIAPPLGREWADPDPRQVDQLRSESEALGWREALAQYEKDNQFFVRRMTNLSLANWHVLLLKDRAGAALDVGCGFGSLALGLGEYYRQAVGLDALQGRVAYAALRQRQDRRSGTSFLRGTGLGLPFRAGSFDLTTLNGVLEWAGYHAAGEPRSLQLSMLREARRVLRPGGTAAIAIENRFAMETLLGMPDTHTGVRFVPALPRRLSDVTTRVFVKRPFRTYLYHANGYVRLLLDGGFSQVRVLDLVSSYNDYDFVVDYRDGATYRFLWNLGLVRSFHRRAGTVRHLVARLAPSLLGKVAYAYLLLAGEQVTTVLDESHPVWNHHSLRGQPMTRFRFACMGTRVGSMVVIGHDGEKASMALELGVEENLHPSDEIGLSYDMANQLLPGAHLAGTWSSGRTLARVWRAANS